MAYLPKETTRDQILAALAQFDRGLRPTPKWNGWEQRKAQKFAIEHEHKAYPPKQIISLATGAAVNSFSGGDESNRWLKARGFTIVELTHGNA